MRARTRFTRPRTQLTEPTGESKVSKQSFSTPIFSPELSNHESVGQILKLKFYDFPSISNYFQNVLHNSGVLRV